MYHMDPAHKDFTSADSPRHVPLYIMRAHVWHVACHPLPALLSIPRPCSSYLSTHLQPEIWYGSADKIAPFRMA